MPKVIKSSQSSALPKFSSFERNELEEVVSGETADDEELAEPEPDPAEILAEARLEAERKVQEAYAEGLHRGQQAGEEKFRASVGEAAESLGSVGEALSQGRAQFLEEMERAVVALAQAVSKRVLQRETRHADFELLRNTVRSAVNELLDRERVTVRLNPEDLQALKDQNVSLLDEFDGVPELDVSPDASVGRGGCVLETDSLHVDARLDTQLNKIFDALLE